jgi:hypothetical protein
VPGELGGAREDLQEILVLEAPLPEVEEDVLLCRFHGGPVVLVPGDEDVDDVGIDALRQGLVPGIA